MDPKRPTILVIAAEPALNLAIERVVERHGLAEVVIAADPDHARSLVPAIRFAAVIVDADLPRGHGQRLLAELSVEAPGVRRVAIKRATRKGLDELEQTGLASAAVAKPLDVEELLEACFPGDARRRRAPMHDARVPLALSARRNHRPSAQAQEAGAPVHVLHDATPLQRGS